MAMSASTNAIWIAVIASALDQAYHILNHWTHQIFFIFDLESGTAVYIFSKLIFVFLVSWYVLDKDIGKTILQKSLVISIVGAGAFSVLLSYLYPQQYTPLMHMLHGVAMFIAVQVVLRMKAFK